MQNNIECSQLLLKNKIEKNNNFLLELVTSHYQDWHQVKVEQKRFWGYGVPFILQRPREVRERAQVYPAMDGRDGLTDRLASILELWQRIIQRQLGSP